MNSELDQVDVSTLTPNEAALLFRDRVAQYQRDSGKDLVAAWAATRVLNPELFKRMSIRGDPDVAKVRSVGSFVDSTGVIKGPTVPLPYSSGGSAPKRSAVEMLMPRKAISIPNAGNIEALGLPSDASFEEFR